MTKFAFWNVNRKPLDRLVASFAALHDLDILLLAESEIPEIAAIQALQNSTGQEYRFLGDIPRPGHHMTSRLHLYTRLNSSELEPVSFRGQVRRTKFFRLHQRNPLGLDTLLVLVHAPSKLRGSWVSEHRKFFGNLARSIVFAEEKIVEHDNTILVGDLNADPFEESLASVIGIQGVSAKGIARRGHRKYDGGKHRFFYNPMWGEYRDRRAPTESDDPETPGTYFLKKSPDHRLYWHMYDQVLIRPALLDRFPADGLRIIGRAGSEPLVGPTGTPFPSDHLPILFRVDLSEESDDAG